jgi:hypothetical protein
VLAFVVIDNGNLFCTITRNRHCGSAQSFVESKKTRRSLVLVIQKLITMDVCISFDLL